MERIHGETHMESRDGLVQSRMGLSAGAARSSATGDNGLLSDLGDRASDIAGHLRDSVQHGLKTATAKVETTGVVGAIRNNPLPALGAAFVGGLLIAAISPSTERHWVLERARRQLRTGIISGLSAVAAQELRSLLGGEDGLGSLVGSFLDPEDDDDDFDEDPT